MKVKLIIALLLVIGLADVAFACRRCGFKSCRFVKKRFIVKKAAPSYVPQTIIFNNAGTVPQILSQGSTLYGVRSFQSEIQPYKTSSSDQLHLANRMVDVVGQLSSQASLQLKDETEVNRLLGASQALSTTINAAREHTAALTQAQSFVVTVGPAGEVQMKTLTGQPAQSGSSFTASQPSTDSPLPHKSAAGAFTKCASCHGTDKASPQGGLYVDDSATFSSDVSDKIRAWVRDPSRVANDEMRQVFEGLSETEKGQLLLAVLEREE